MANPIEDLSGEIWKPVVGYEGLYEVSNMGRVKSLDRTIIVSVSHCPHSFLRRVRGRLLRPSRYHVDGYARVALCRAGRDATHLVHAVVLAAFVGPRPHGMECCHNDGNPSNNTLDNLRYDSRSGNSMDKVRHGTHNRGTNHWNSKFTPDDIRAIRHAHACGAPSKEIALRYNTNAKYIRAVVTRVKWTWLL